MNMNQPLQEWFDNQRATTSDLMSFKSVSAKKIMFVRDELCGIPASGIEDRE
jgi:hypothetical protein